MKRKDLKEGWGVLSDEIMVGVAEWRSQYPKATQPYLPSPTSSDSCFQNTPKSGGGVRCR